MALIGQTVTIVNKSGKVVSSSKHLVNVFNEAKSAYSERKAEIKAMRRGHSYSKSDDRKTLNRVETLTIDDDSDTSSRRSSRRGSEDGRSSVRRKPVPNRSHRERPPIERGVSDSYYTNDHSQSPRSHQRRHSHRPSPLRQQSYSSEEDPARFRELTRRHTDGLELTHSRPSKTSRSASADDIDMDLAYGDLPPPLPERNYDTEVELRQKMSGLQKLLDECNCIQHSVTATIDNLQKNPDALAAVALTLAEISNLATKMAPGALMSMKGAFPAIIAILASPEFMIAAGVGVGVTVIALGGYKIVKKIKAKRAESGMLIEADPDADYEPGTPDSETELRELDKIEQWRRGIADVEASSVGTSVDGEFVTPRAKTELILEGKLTEKDLKAREKREKKERKKEKKAESEVSGRSKGSKKKAKEEGAKAKKEKSEGGIKMLFKGRS
ncbi:uncharacterized protein LTR77_010338 [Saxophila tyrrhenica]|uniref:Uncharacterized protein n=1 Tax=Saxophila tyrrhenica TaxID=1690608 RepID=A0AAV9NXH8_9PEZI|nr:hypothetical protein LTR77_010338 [Saxophila tyrrhenica]